MFYIISYDIPDDKRRNKVAQSLENYGTRVQYSVFECVLETVKLKELSEEIKSILNFEEDSLRIYSLCSTCLHRAEIVGIGEITKDAEVYVV